MSLQIWQPSARSSGHRIQCAAALVLGLTVFQTGAAAAADNYDVSRIGYYNGGVYTACMQVRWRRPSGKEFRTTPNEGHCANAGKTKFWQLKNVTTETNVKIQQGDEVWAKIQIQMGDSKNCRKSEKKFFYQETGGTVTYRTAGTTLNDNRCRVLSTP